jgi:hypothetical protein
MVNGREIRATMSGTKTDLRRLATCTIQDNGSIHYPAPDAPSPLLTSRLRYLSVFCRLHSMLYQVSADLIVLLHLGFVLFVLLGGFLLIKWPRLMWLHLPAVAWGAFVEFSGWICPLTPLENWLRARAGETTYAGDFIVRSLTSILYPGALTHEIQLILGTALLVVNLAIYSWLRQTPR